MAEDIVKLRVGTDPFIWVHQGMSCQALATEIGQATGPVPVEVMFPLQGTLVLSPAAGSVAVLGPAGVGWRPSDAIRPKVPLLYVPSTIAPTVDAPGYLLAPGTDLAALQQQIIAAMTARSALTVPVSEPDFLGAAVLHGATLAYAVLCPSAPGA